MSQFFSNNIFKYFRSLKKITRNSNKIFLQCEKWNNFLICITLSILHSVDLLWFCTATGWLHRKSLALCITPSKCKNIPCPLPLIFALSLEQTIKVDFFLTCSRLIFKFSFGVANMLHCRCMRLKLRVHVSKIRCTWPNLIPGCRF